MKQVLLLMLAIALLSGCITGEAIDTQETLTIGMLMPLSGPAAGLGNTLLETSSWKIEELQSNGANIRMIVQDSESSPSAAILGFSYLVQEGADIIITPMSSVGLAVKPLAEEQDVLLWSIAAHPNVTTDTKHVIRHSNFGDSDAEKIASVIHEEDIAIIFQQDDWGVSIANSFTKYKNISSFERIDQTNQDFRTTITKVFDSDAVVIVVVGSAAGILIKQLRERGYEGEIYSSVGLILTPGISKFGEGHISGTYYQTYDVNPLFAQDYSEEFETEASPFGYVGYSDIELIWNAYQTTGSKDAKTLVNYFRNQTSIQLTYELAKINGQDIPVPTVMKIWE